MDEDDPKNEIRELSSVQQRVIGVLMEKAFTTPDQYPLTLKALTTGCNQKSNRSPVTNYSEDAVLSTVDELRDMMLVAEVFTDGGRAPRYRHYMRYRFDFSEQEFAIIAELLLRGSQQPGELRTRASRMVRIDSQDLLRSCLSSLQEKGFVRASGPLDRRGVQVDHTYYPAADAPAFGDTEVESAQSSAGAVQPGATAAVNELSELKATVERQQQEIDGLKQAVARLEELLN